MPRINKRIKVVKPKNSGQTSDGQKVVGVDGRRDKVIHRVIVLPKVFDMDL